MLWRSRWYFILLLLIVLPVMHISAATDVRIGTVAVDSVGTVANQLESVSSTVSAWVTQFLQPEEFSDEASLRMKAQNRIDLLNRRHSAIIAEDGNTSAIELESEVVENSSSITTVPVTVDRTLSDLLVENDVITGRYLIDQQQLDLLLVWIVEPFDKLIRLRVMEYRTTFESPHMLYEGLSVPMQLQSLLPQALVAVFGTFSQEPVGLLHFSNSPPGVQISLDGDGLSLVESMALVSAGTHTIQVNALGHTQKKVTVSVAPDSVLHFDASLIPITGPPLLITSSSGNTKISINQIVDTSVPIVIEQQQAPFALYATEDNRREQTLQFAQGVDEIVLSLQPRWMDPVYGTAREQDALYASLGRTLLSSALSIILESVSQSVISYTNDTTLWQPLLLGAVGATAVSFFDTATRLFAYYQKTKYSSR